MVREEDHLSPLGERAQDLKPGASALVVKVDEDVVDYERQRLVRVEVALKAGDS